MKPTLIVLAAGMGSRYGSLKQMDKLGPSGESIIDYSVYDAIRAGFGKVVFVLREEIVDDFYAVFANKYKNQIKVDHVVQRLEDVPEGMSYSSERKKPWGTAHAVLSAAKAVKEPFAVINADDFYGAKSFRVLAEFLSELNTDDKVNQCMVGFTLKNTLSENGYVSRGICEVDGNQLLTGVTERTHIEKKDGKIFYQDGEKEVQLSGEETVSMNIWGFTTNMFDEMEEQFKSFILENANELKAEFYIPSVANKLIQENKIKLKVLPTTDIWFGVTYKEDKESVIEKICGLIAKGEYPDNLWA